MTYDFSSLTSRHGSDSQKWQKYRGRDVLPMWVADMDFHAAPEIVAALRSRADEGVFGYCRPTDSQIEAVVGYLERSFDWSTSPEWFVWMPGMVPGINLACRAIGGRGDAVVTFTPVYPPFLSAPRLAERECQAIPLRQVGERWEIDWDLLAKTVHARTKLLLLCHPHNPVGRVWRRAELERLAAFCAERGIVICSDEIHCDLILEPTLRHIPLATLDETVANRTITLIAPSKTYNIAGLGCSVAIIPDAALRTAFRRAGQGVLAEVNNFGYVACEAAYRHGEPWRQALLQRLRANRDLIFHALADGQLPGISATPVEATYLAWLNVEALHLEDPVAFFEAAGVGLSGGAAFGDSRYVRLNFGCPESLLHEGLRRMSTALQTQAKAMA